MGGRRLFRWPGLLVVATVAVGALIVTNPLVWLDDETPTGEAGARARSEIALATLSTTLEVDGELTSIEARSAIAVGPGTITEMIAIGTPVEAATVLFRLDDRPTIALIGEVPAWRAIAIDDEGDDVEQLESNLVALGYDPETTVDVDQVFTANTAAMVQRWQTDLGLAPTGVVELGSVVFLPQPAVVTAISADVGQGTPAGGTQPILTLSGLDRHLVFPVEADDLDTIDVGSPVEARLPDRGSLEARVTAVGPVGDGTWQAVASVVGSAELPDGESVPVSVSWTSVVAEDVPAVRANAITRLDTGAYVVEVVEGDQTRLVEVEIGGRSGSTIELVTDLAPGTVVIAP